MNSHLKNLTSDFSSEIQNCQNLADLKNIEIKYLGRNGLLTEELKKIKDLSEEEKRTVGPQLQEVKNTFQNLFTQKSSQLETAEINAKLNSEFFDISLPELNPKITTGPGTIHPLTLIQMEVEEIFSQMGFTIADGPEVESEYYNFEALNIPSHHPARDMQDTFFVDQPKDAKHGHLLLRTHTSPVQIRAMEKFGSPLRLIIPGRVFRYEATDATHDSCFNQVEGLVIDKNISLSDFKGIILEFLKRLFQREITIRFRPGYFPFVEPGIELDILWKKGQNGQPDKWLEFMGAGMVHPNVLKAGGLDGDKHQGWAFGFGLTRLAMLKYQIDDLRLLHSNDLRFLNQFIAN